MQFFDVVKARRSIRAFQRKEVREKHLRRILESINAAPSAGNLQAYEVVVVTDRKKREALARACKRDQQLERAPVVLVFFRDQKRSSARFGPRGKGLYSIQDATIACAYAQLAAAAQGLSTCWIGAFDEKPVAKLLNAKRWMIPLALLPIGYAAESPPEKERRALTDLVKRESL